MKYIFIKPKGEVLQLVKNISQKSKKKYIYFNILNNYLIISIEIKIYTRRIPKKPRKEKQLTLVFTAL